MMLTHALELVIEDTRENTDPDLTMSAAISMARELTLRDLTVVDDSELRTAYIEVMRADQSRIDFCLGL